MAIGVAIFRFDTSQHLANIVILLVATTNILYLVIRTVSANNYLFSPLTISHSKQNSQTCRKSQFTTLGSLANRGNVETSIRPWLHVKQIICNISTHVFCFILHKTTFKTFAKCFTLKIKKKNICKNCFGTWLATGGQRLLNYLLQIHVFCFFWYHGLSPNCGRFC